MRFIITKIAEYTDQPYNGDRLQECSLSSRFYEEFEEAFKDVEILNKGLKYPAFEVRELTPSYLKKVEEFKAMNLVTVDGRIMAVRNETLPVFNGIRESCGDFAALQFAKFCLNAYVNTGIIVTGITYK